MTDYQQDAIDFLKKYGRWFVISALMGLSIGLSLIMVADYVIGINKDSARIARHTVEIARAQADIRLMDQHLAKIEQRLDAVEIGLGKMALELDAIKRMAVEYVRQQQQVVRVNPEPVRIRSRRTPKAKAGS